MQPITTLPANYVHLAKLDLSENKRLLIGINIVGLLLLFVLGWLFLHAFVWLRPAAAVFLSLRGAVEAERGEGVALTLLLAWFIGGAIALVLVVVVHEAVHGLFFWLFTGRRPGFGLKGAYAYAAAPAGVYVPRNRYLVVGLAPLVLITLVGLLLVTVMPPVMLPALLVFVTFNAAGSVGDLLVSGWLLTFPPTVLAQDAGDVMTLYGPAETA